MADTESFWKAADEEEFEQAYAAMAPYLTRLLHQVKAFHAQGVRPFGVLVPEWFPKRCNGGRLFGLPVFCGPVAEPAVVSDV